VYELHGCFYLGDPVVYPKGKVLHSDLSSGQLYDETIERENNIRSLGYNLVVMWESEWSGME
jgi:hypothetical protein